MPLLLSVMNLNPTATGEPAKYKGVRRRKWGKWVSEIRLPNSRERIWLGSYDSQEKAARAFDAALYCLRGRHAKFNFPDHPPEILDGHSLTSQQIQEVAAKFANEYCSTSQNDAVPAPDPPSAASPAVPTLGDWSHFLENLDPVHEGAGSTSNSLSIYSDQFDNMVTNELYQTHDGHVIGFHHEEEVELYDDVSGHDSFSHQSFLWNFGNN